MQHSNHPQINHLLATLALAAQIKSAALLNLGTLAQNSPVLTYSGTTEKENTDINHMICKPVAVRPFRLMSSNSEKSQSTVATPHESQNEVSKDLIEDNES
jgi:hypothetical protein